MPNWSSNSLNIVKATDEQLDKIVAAVTAGRFLHEYVAEPDWANMPNEDGVYPGPRYRSKWLRTQTFEGKQIWRCQSNVTCRRFPDGSADERWYRWRNSHEGWGTKWEITDPEISRDGQSFELSFLTAWCPPNTPWFAALSRAMPQATITCSFNEPGCDFFGVIYAKDGRASVRYATLSDVRDSCWKQHFSKDDFAIYKDEDHELHDEVFEKFNDYWRDNEGEVLAEAVQPMIDEMIYELEVPLVVK